MWKSITPETFVAEWGIDEELLLEDQRTSVKIDFRELVRLPPTAATFLPISPADKRFLVQAGLPRNSGVFSICFEYLEEDELGELEEYLPSDMNSLLVGNSLYVIGRRGMLYKGWESSKVVIEAGTSLIYMVVFSDVDPEHPVITKQYMNAGVAQMAFTFLVYKRLFEMPFHNDALLEGFDSMGEYWLYAKRRFAEAVNRFDPTVLRDEAAFWPTMLKRLGPPS